MPVNVFIFTPFKNRKPIKIYENMLYFLLFIITVKSLGFEASVSRIKVMVKMQMFLLCIGKARRKYLHLFATNSLIYKNNRADDFMEKANFMQFTFNTKIKYI